MDDSVTTVSAEYVNEICTFELCSSWFAINKLRLNDSKTHLLFLNWLILMTTVMKLL